MLRVEGKVALVAGAVSGSVRGIAKSFVAEGAFVEVTDLQDVPGAALAKSLGSALASIRKPGS